MKPTEFRGISEVAHQTHTLRDDTNGCDALSMTSLSTRTAESTSAFFIQQVYLLFFLEWKRGI